MLARTGRSPGIGCSAVRDPLNSLLAARLDGGEGWNAAGRLRAEWPGDLGAAGDQSHELIPRQVNCGLVDVQWCHARLSRVKGKEWIAPTSQLEICWLSCF